MRIAKVTRRFDNADGSLKLDTTLGRFEFPSGATQVQAALK